MKNKNKKNIFRYLPTTAFLMLGFMYIIKFGGPSLLRLYVQSGVGNCEKIPIICASPDPEIITAKINREYAAGLLPYRLPGLSISLPKGYTAVKDDIKKVYYKKFTSKDRGNIARIIYEKPGYLVSLFPELTKEGIIDDFKLIRRAMFSTLNDIKTPNDAFFVILKSMSMLYLGDKAKVIMREFAIAGNKGFINYNSSGPVKYFDCNIIDTRGNFFKIYIEDREGALGLEEVLTIISTIRVEE